ncbi:MAG: hypothetical protein SGILL_003117, partial [Bacillariaceae sp.]
YYRVERPEIYSIIPNDANVEGAEAFFASSENNSNNNNNNTVKDSLKIYSNCTIVMDWGVERAAWFEVISDNDLIGNPSVQVAASISEFNQPYPGKTKELVRYNDTYRLETNDELYEGVRFSFLHIEFMDDAVTAPVQISDISLVAKVKPIAYTGSFHSANPLLTEAWYTGAYAVRLNMEENDFNSILIERGDRVAIQGDGHPTMDAALVSFSSFNLIKNVLNQTDSSHKRVVDDNIMAYPLYWSLSAMDYFMASGDFEFFQQQLAPDIQIILDKRIADFLDPNLDITWFGWDDRIGNGWCFHSKNDKCTREALLAFAALVIRVCNDFSRVLALGGMPDLAKEYQQQSASMSTRLRQVPEYPNDFGVHAAANVLNAKTVATLNETQYWMSTTLNDPVTICSFSAFNQYWILQGFGNAGSIDAMEHALESIELCWGPMLTLGKGCFWEMSSPEWLRFMKDGDQAPHLPSYCHPWASGVTPWLSHFLAGLNPLAPGYGNFSVTPYVSATHPAVGSSIQTPHGKLSVNANLHTNMTFHAWIDGPTCGLLGLRSMVLGFNGATEILQEETVRVNGVHSQPLSMDDVPSQYRSSLANEGHEMVFFLLDGSKRYFVEARFGLPSIDENMPVYSRQLIKTTSFPQPIYPAQTGRLDRTSQGDGLWQYGKDGYVLFGCGGSASDIHHLPTYIANVTVIRHGFPGYVDVKRELVGYSDHDRTYLPLSGRRGRVIGKRGLGRIGYNDAGGGDINCIVIDVELAEEHIGMSYSLSVYSVAESSENSHAIRVMDGSTLNVVAPTPLIKEYTKGVWWTMHYNKSIRLKVMDVKGIFVSALGFQSS